MRKAYLLGIIALFVVATAATIAGLHLRGGGSRLVATTEVAAVSERGEANDQVGRSVGGPSAPAAGPAAVASGGEESEREVAGGPTAVPGVANLGANVTYPDKHDLSPAMSAIPPVAPSTNISQQDLENEVSPGFALTGKGPLAPVPLLPAQPLAPGAMPAPVANFDGIDNTSGYFPPDTEGTIGYDPATGKKYYFQWVNISFAIWDVTNPSTPVKVYPAGAGFAAGNTIWSTFGGACETSNQGDPIVMYDQLAGRWFMSQFAWPGAVTSGPWSTCIAVSATGDPTGAWYRYAWTWVNGNGNGTSVLNDYPKFGVWPDGYYMSVHQFASGSAWDGVGVGVFERTQMLVGGSARLVSFDLYNANMYFWGMLPAGMDGTAAPPAGSPDYFAEWDDALSPGLADPTDTVRLWKFHVDWVTPGNSTFGLSQQPDQKISTSNVNVLCPSSSHCIPEPGGNTVATLADRLMYRLVYRNYGDHEALLTNHTVNIATPSAPQAGIHWFELRRTGAAWSLYQDGIVGANDGLSRWMGSVALDHVGNMALGYSASGTASNPSIRYTGRLSSDPLGTMPQGEVTVVQGAGEQLNNTAWRWGDYSAMTLDPVDDCTFWYTQEYYPVSSNVHWYTRIAAFTFPNCTSAPDLSVTKVADRVVATAGGPLNYTINVNNKGTGVATGVVITDTLPANVTAIAPFCTGYAVVSPSVFRCNVTGYMPAGASASTVISAQVGPAANGALVNQVVVGSGRADANPADNSAIGTAFVGAIHQQYLPLVVK